MSTNQPAQRRFFWACRKASRLYEIGIYSIVQTRINHEQTKCLGVGSAWELDASQCRKS